MISRPIHDIEAGKAYIRHLVETGQHYHLEDRAGDIVRCCQATGALVAVFTAAEAAACDARATELYALEWGPEHECPIGYLLTLLDNETEA